jgi:hypothetical protein
MAGLLNLPKRKTEIAGITDNPVGGPDEADSEIKKEEDDLDRQARHARIIGVRQDIEERKKYADRIFYLVSVWLASILILLLMRWFLSPLHIFSCNCPGP